MDIPKNPENPDIQIHTVVNSSSQHLDINSEESRKDTSDTSKTSVPTFFISVDGKEVCYVRGIGNSPTSAREVTVLPEKKLSDELLRLILTKLSAERINGLSSIFYTVMGPFKEDGFDIEYHEYVFRVGQGLQRLNGEP